MKYSLKFRNLITALLVVAMTFTTMLTVTSCVSEDKKTADDNAKKDEINLFIAASLTDSINELVKDFEKENPGVKVVVNADSSGKLKTQIEEGFDCDIFFSAATKQVDELIEGKFIESKDNTSVVLENQLAVIANKDYDKQIEKLIDVKNAESLAIPYGSVPAGLYTRKAFINYGILKGEAKKEKVVAEIPGSDISKALGGVTVSEQNNVSTVISAISEKSAELGFAYSSDVNRNEDVKVVYKVSKELTGDISYPIALVKAKADEDKAHMEMKEKLYKFLQTEYAKKVYEKYGFIAK